MHPLKESQTISGKKSGKRQRWTFKVQGFGLFAAEPAWKENEPVQNTNVVVVFVIETIR